MPDRGHPCSTRVQYPVAPRVAVIILWLQSEDIDVAISIEAPRATESRAEKILNMLIWYSKIQTSANLLLRTTLWLSFAVFVQTDEGTAMFLFRVQVVDIAPGLANVYFYNPLGNFQLLNCLNGPRS